jgi:CubicO group peptidase (beta-lactamase class C family)
MTRSTHSAGLPGGLTGRPTPLASVRRPAGLTVAAIALLLSFSFSFSGHAGEAGPLPAGRPAREGFDPVRLGRVRETAERFVADSRHAGIAWLVARNGKAVDYGAAGTRDVAGGLAMEKDTICRVYSMSKIVTSVAVLILMEDGRLTLDQPVSDFLPALGKPKVMTGGTVEAPQLVEAVRPVTVRHLLTHTSGYIYDFDGEDALHRLYQAKDLWNSTSLKDFTERVAALPLRHQPGDAFTYGINTDILGAVLEAVSGQSFEDFIQARICGPLGMRDTSFDVAPEKAGRLSKIHSSGPGGKLVEAQDFLGAYPERGRGIPCGGAGLFSTVGDFARFAQMLCNGGELEGHRVLGRKTVELMTSNQLLSLTDPSHAFNRAKGFGLGVEVQLDLGRSGQLATPGQFGWYGAATTYCQIDPKERLVAVAFAQHFPFNQHGFFARFANAYYQALR